MQFRETLIKIIIQSTDTLSVGIVIDNSMEKLAENGTHPFITLRFIEKLKTSLSEIKREKISEKEKTNIAQALNTLENYDVKKIIRTRDRKL